MSSYSRSSQQVKLLFKNSLFRHFLSGTLFAASFVWVAVYFFDVDTEIVTTFFIMSFIFVGSMILVGLVLAPIITLSRKKKSKFVNSFGDSQEGIKNNENQGP